MKMFSFQRFAAGLALAGSLLVPQTVFASVNDCSGPEPTTGMNYECASDSVCPSAPPGFIYNSVSIAPSICAPGQGGDPRCCVPQKVATGPSGQSCGQLQGDCKEGTACPQSWQAQPAGSCDGGKICCIPVNTCKALKGDCFEKCQGGSVSNYEGNASCPKGQICCVPTGSGAGGVPSKGTPGSTIKIEDPLAGAGGIVGVVGRLISTFLGIVGAVALLVFVYAGILYMTAAGNDKQVTEARDAMKYAFIGIAIIMFAYVISKYYIDVLTGAVVK